MLNIPEADAIVIGTGPNGLAAAIVMAQAGVKVTVLEASHQIGGSCHSAALTLPGFSHDVCASVFPLGIGSPFFRTLPLAKYGLEWTHPDAPLAHPLDDGRVATLERSIDKTAAALGRDGIEWKEVVGSLAEKWDDVAGDLLAPLRWPKHPVDLAKFGLSAFRSAWELAHSKFREDPSQALFAGCAGHIMLPLEHRLTAAFGIVLSATAHAVGWPYAKGGAQRLSDALASHLRSLGGEIVTGVRVQSLDDLPPAKAILCDVSPKNLARIAASRLPRDYVRRLEKYRHGPGAFKIDWALNGPVPWKYEQCLRAGTLHLAGTIDEIARSERAPWEGHVAEKPLVIFAQHSLFDPTRAPAGQHTAWAYCHVPNNCSEDMTDRVEAQVERFAPGFRNRIIARHTIRASNFEAVNPNIVGGDINDGVPDFRQMFTRPTWRTYATPAKGLYICSAATPPGGGVHGMCGFFAANLALRKEF